MLKTIGFCLLIAGILFLIATVIIFIKTGCKKAIDALKYSQKALPQEKRDEMLDSVYYDADSEIKSSKHAKPVFKKEDDSEELRKEPAPEESSVVQKKNVVVPKEKMEKAESKTDEENTMPLQADDFSGESETQPLDINDNDAEELTQPLGKEYIVFQNETNDEELTQALSDNYYEKAVREFEAEDDSQSTEPLDIPKEDNTMLLDNNNEEEGTDILFSETKKEMPEIMAKVADYEAENHIKEKTEALIAEDDIF